MKKRGGGNVTRAVNERWDRYCFDLGLLNVDDRIMTKAEAIAGWLRDGWTWSQCIRHFDNLCLMALYDIEGQVNMRDEALARWQAAGYSRTSCEAYFRRHARRKSKRLSRSVSPGLETFVKEYTEAQTEAQRTRSLLR